MSNKATQQEQDFAIVMQKLSAEAEKILPGDQSNSLPEVRDPTEPGQPPHAFFERLHGLENSVWNRLEQIAAQTRRGGSPPGGLRELPRCGEILSVVEHARTPKISATDRSGMGIR